MRGRIVLVAAALVVLAPALAGALEVAILSPTASEPAVGRVRIVAQVAPEADAAKVEFFLDGRHIGTATTPPFVWIVPLQASPGEHVFEVVATGRDGDTARARVITPGLSVDQELEIELLQLYLTATRQGEPVLDLERGDFEILDNSRLQEIVTFERGDVPITAVFLIDASDSMSGQRLKTALASTRAFVDRMQPLDRARLVAFSDRVVQSTPFTGFKELLLAGTLGVEPSGSTALNDHVYLALRMLETVQGRRVAVVLSDGQDIASVLEMERVRAALKGTNTLLYWVRLANADPDREFHTAWRDARQNAAERRELELAVPESGGRILDIGAVEESGSAFADILRELRNQYVIGYYPGDRMADGSWHEIEVRTSDRSVEIRTRDGYFDRK